jgi:elongation factor P
MDSAYSLAAGNTILFNGQAHKVLEVSIERRTKAAPLVNTKLKNIENGKTLPNSFEFEAKIEKVTVEVREYRGLYRLEDTYIFESKTTEQRLTLPLTTFSKPNFLHEGITLYVTYLVEYDKILLYELPTSAVFRLSTVKPVSKWTPPSDGMTEAMLENGMPIRVPATVKSSDLVRVDPDFKFIEVVPK